MKKYLACFVLAVSLGNHSLASSDESAHTEVSYQKKQEEAKKARTTYHFKDSQGNTRCVTNLCLEQVPETKWQFTWKEFWQQYGQQHGMSAAIMFGPLAMNVQLPYIFFATEEANIGRGMSSLATLPLSLAWAGVGLAVAPIYVPITLARELMIPSCKECGVTMARNHPGWDGGKICCHNPKCHKCSHIMSVRSELEHKRKQELALSYCKNPECHDHYDMRVKL